MRKDIMENAGLTLFAEIGVILFVVVFALILLRTIFMSKEKVKYAGNLPLDGGELEPHQERDEKEVAQ